MAVCKMSVPDLKPRDDNLFSRDAAVGGMPHLMDSFTTHILQSSTIKKGA
jgi:hypothetical protein